MKLELRDYPLILLKDIQVLLQDLKLIALKNSNIIEPSKDDKNLFIAKETYPNSKFYFRVFSPGLNAGKPEYHFSKLPHSEHSLKPYEGTGNREFIAQSLTNWLDTISQYHSLPLDEEDFFEKKYEKEFYEDFKIMDEDAQTSTFNFSQQIALNNYIQNTIIYLEDPQTEIEEDDRKELIEEAKKIEKSISTESKEVVIKRNSKFWAKARKKSISICKFIITEFAKEVIKEGAKIGFHFAKENLPNYIETIKNLLT